MSNTPFPSGLTPDGGGFISLFFGPTNFIADVNAPINSLVGVFLDSSQPDSSAQPGALDFSSIGLNFTSLSPGLKQVFFIGDGLTGTGSGSVQQFIAPAGATRLFLGTMDGYEWNNNFGAFSVAATCVPEPGAVATGAILFGGLGIGLFRARRKS